MSPAAIAVETPQIPAKPSRAESSRWVPIAFIAVYILWGSTDIGIRIAIETVPPLAMVAIRHSLVGLLLYPFLRWKTGIRPTRAQWVTTAVTGVLLLCVANGGLSWAETRVPSGIAALLLATISLWLVILDWLRPGGTRPVPRVLVGLILGFVGLALLGRSRNCGRRPPHRPAGAGVLMVGAFVWACASIYSKHRPMPASPLLSIAMQSLARRRGAVDRRDLLGRHFTPCHRRVDFRATLLDISLPFIYLVVFELRNRIHCLHIHFKDEQSSQLTYGLVPMGPYSCVGPSPGGSRYAGALPIAAAVILHRRGPGHHLRRAECQSSLPNGSPKPGEPAGCRPTPFHFAGA